MNLLSIKQRVLNPLYLSSCLSLLGCSTLPPPQAVPFDAPQKFEASLATDASLHSDWWQNFNSPQLNGLIEQTLVHSPDLKMATERVLQAEYALRSAGSSRYPSLALSGGLGVSQQLTEQTSTRTESTNAKLTASYELDLWQRNAAILQNNQASLGASEFDWVAARLSLTASVAQTYFEILALKERLTLAEQNLAIAQRLLDIVEVKYQNGVVTRLDVSRQKTAVLNQKATLIPLANQLKQSQAALALLVGLVPQNFTVEMVPLTQLNLVNVAAGLPSELLKRRPDLAASEQRLKLADTDIYLAKTERWPQLSLTASGGVASASLLALSAPTSSLALAAGLTQTLFDGGKTQAAIDTAESKYREALQSHYKLILTALVEVEQALGNIQTYQTQEQAQQQTLEEAQRSLSLAEFRYQEGADDLSTVLDAQRTLFQTQEELVQIRQQRLSATVDLYKTLGGGWQKPATNHEIKPSATSF